MIRSFRNRALESLWKDNDVSQIGQEYISRLRILMDRLHAATKATDMRVPGSDFHPLKGPMKGRYAVKVSGNMRLTFGWNGNDAINVDFGDYH